MSLESVSRRPVNVIGKDVFFIQLGILHVLIDFGFKGSLALPLPVGTSFIHWLFKEIFLMKRHIITKRSDIVEIFRKHAPVRPVDYIIKQLDADSSTENQWDDNARTALFKIMKCSAMPPNTDGASISVTTRSTGLIYMAL